MSTRTPNYSLHQWEGDDLFLRSDFNEDLATLDQAVFQARQAGLDANAATSNYRQELLARDQRLWEAIAPLQYNLWQLALQRRYEGKTGGLQRGLIYDGFFDESKVAAMEPGCMVDAINKRMMVVKTGQSTVSVPYAGELNSSSGYNLTVGPPINYVSNQDLKVAGYCTLHSIQLRCMGYTVPIQTQLHLFYGEERLTSSGVVTVSTNVYADYTFPISAQLHPGRTYRLQIQVLTPNMTLTVSASATHRYVPGWVLTTTPIHCTGGFFTTKAADIAYDYTGGRAFARHSGGSVSLWVKNGAGALFPFAVVGTRDTVTESGAPCQETEYVLNAAPPAPNRSVTMKLGLDGADCVLYDYGVAFQ